ncbi:MAG: M23 family metallopeptidase [Corallococcus sp.]|nr:M23 family metallopeptidase [Corallococcus sp.]
MEQYDEITAVECEAVENEWLDVTYTAKKYLADEIDSRKFFKKTHKKFAISVAFKKIAAYVGAAAVCVALVIGLTLSDGNFQGNAFETARATVITSVFDYGRQPVSNTITLPATINVDNVENGVITFSGGRALVSFTNGVVEAVEEGTITVKMDDNTKIVYSGATDCFVKAGDSISARQLLARYDGTASASIMHDGETVVNVVGSETSIKWSV